jgi:5'-methylthioadenosine phosphorylase
MQHKDAIGVIGGSGLYEMEGLVVTEEAEVETPFGAPSDSYVVGELEGRRVVFLPRHGRGHRLMPHELNFRANIYGLKKLGVERILSVSAVGSLREDIHPRDLMLPDQFIDRTQGREGTFFGDGVVAHVSFADPVCPALHAALESAASACGATVRAGGAYVCIQGPAFSSRAESELFRSWGASVVGMTNLPEAKLAREAEMCYATMALVTDYDCWHRAEEAVTAEMILDNLRASVATARQVLRRVVSQLPQERACGCADALAKALVTAPDAVEPQARRRLDVILSKYVE